MNPNDIPPVQLPIEERVADAEQTMIDMLDEIAPREQIAKMVEENFRRVSEETGVSVILCKTIIVRLGQLNAEGLEKLGNITLLPTNI